MHFYGASKVTRGRGRPTKQTPLRQWLDRHPEIDAGELAQTLGITRGTFEKYANGANPIPWKRAFELEKFSEAQTPNDKLDHLTLTFAS